MGLAYDLGINISAAAIGAIAATGGARSIRAARSRRTRRLWRFLREPTLFVVGELDSKTLLNTLDNTLSTLAIASPGRQQLYQAIVEHVRRQEFSKLIGLGDFEALSTIVSTMATAGLPIRHEVVHVSQVGDREESHNLVLLGGSDTNDLTRRLAPQMGCKLSAQGDEQSRNVVRDTYPSEPHDYLAELSTLNGREQVIDYGVLAYGHHPNAREKTVMIVSGAHGFGTLAAARICTDPSQLHILEGALPDFECLVEYEQLGQGPPVISLPWPPRRLERA